MRARLQASGRMIFTILLNIGDDAVSGSKMEKLAVELENDGRVSASQRRDAALVRVSRTACRSKVERLMTLSTSAVAVCCCSDSQIAIVRAAH